MNNAFARYENAITADPDVANEFGELSQQCADRIVEGTVTKSAAARILCRLTLSQFGIRISEAYAAHELDYDLGWHAKETEEDEVAAMENAALFAASRGVQVLSFRCVGQKRRLFAVRISFMFEGRLYKGFGESTSPAAALNTAMRNSR